jgi:hypothetical protein
MNISKSKFVAGVQCLKRLYWQVHAPELAAKPDASTERVFAQGHEVGALARKAFPGGVEVKADHGSLQEAIHRTKDLIDSNGVSAIYEATFSCGGVLVRVDVLERRPAGKWRLVEVKSSTSVKDYYLYDIGIQHRVVTDCGLKVSSASLMHLNKDYVYDGSTYDLERLFTIEDQTAEVKSLKNEIGNRLREQFTILKGSKPPDVTAGPQCTDPVQCEFYDQCNPPLPDDHVSFLPGIAAKKVARLAELGISSVGGIPQEFPLNEKQKRACACMKSGTPWRSEQLQAALSGVTHPLFFMDFETYGPAIPKYAGTRPYFALPFQWSVHVLKRFGEPSEHHEFLADSAADPRPEFIEALCRVLGKAGTIVVYNQGFEEQRLSEIAAFLPSYKPQIEAIQARLWDLLPIIRNHVYHPKFAGSFSLKKVLPALVPELAYEGMEIAAGDAAGPAWAAMVSGEVDSADRQRLRQALLTYCKQDTFAMVRLMEVLRGRALGV